MGHVLAKFLEVCTTNRKVFAELCFWKTPLEANQIVAGYDKEIQTAKQKKAFWTEEQEETLNRVFRQLKEDGVGEGVEGDLLDAITAHFDESGKSRRQVTKKLKEMQLIRNTSEVTRKSVRSKVAWNEVELEMVEQLYQEFKDAHEPVARVKERLGNKKTKGQIAAKILEMGWCDDPAKLKVSKSSRKRRTGDELQKSSSESDSAMEDSSSDGGGSDGGSSEAPADNEPAGHGTKAEQLVQLIKKMLEPSRPDSDVLLSCLSWLSEAVGEEADDRCGSGDEDGAEDVPMVAVDAAVADALADSPELKQLMQLIQLSPPASHQEQYWRIPASVSGISLRAKQSGVAENGGVDAEQIGKQS